MTTKFKYRKAPLAEIVVRGVVNTEKKAPKDGFDGFGKALAVRPLRKTEAPLTPAYKETR